MDVNYTLDTTGLQEMARQFPQYFKEETKAVMQLVVTRVEGEVVANTPSGVGGEAGLRGSIAGEVYVRGMTVTGLVGTPLPYAEVVEDGRRPGQKMPPPKALELWVNRKMGVLGADIPKVAFLVARKIAVRGTDGVHMFENAMKRLEPWRIDMFNTIPGRIARRAESDL